MTRIAAQLLVLLWIASVCAAMDVQGFRIAAGMRPPQVKPIVRTPGADADSGLTNTEEDPNVAVAMLTDAEALAASGQAANAASRFQEAIERFEGVLVPCSPQTFFPVSRYCRYRLLALGGEVLESYRAANEPRAKTELAAALAERSTDKLHAVVRRFGATDSGAEALDALASLALERGDVAAGVEYCRQYLSTAEPSPDAVAKCAILLGRQGDHVALDRLARAVIEFTPDMQYRGALLASFVTGLAKSLPDSSPQALESVPRPSILLWQQKLKDTKSGYIVFLPQGRRPGPPPVLPSSMPVISNGRIICQTSGHIRMFDLLGGRLLWEIATTPQWQRSVGGVMLQSEQPYAEGGGYLAPALLGESVAVAFRTEIYFGPPTERQMGPVGRIDVVPIARPDQTIWSVNLKDQGTSEEPLPPLIATTRPALVGDVMCVAARYSSNSDTYLLGYSAATGRLLWRTRVAPPASAVEPRFWPGMPDDSPLIVRGSTVFLSSDTGMITATDSASGQILWAFRYESARPLGCPVRVLGGESAIVPAPANPPILVGNTLFVLPSDSGYLLALDAETGMLKWRRPRAEGDVYLYLLGGDAGRLYVSGSTAACIDSSTGDIIWKSVPFDSLPAGRGLVSQDIMLVPVESGIAAVDMKAEGRLQPAVMWRDKRQGQIVPVGSGNLVAVDGRLIIVRNDSISVLCGDDAEEKCLDRIKQDPHDPRPRLELAMVLARTKRPGESVARFKQAISIMRERGTDTTDVENELAAIYDEWADELEAKRAWKECADALAGALMIETDGSHRAGHSLRLAVALEKAGDPARALDVLQKVLADSHDVRITLDGRTNTAARLVAATELNEIIRKHPDVYAPYEAQARALSDADALLRLFPNSRAAMTKRAELAATALREGKALTADRLINEIRRLAPYEDKQGIIAGISMPHVEPTKSNKPLFTPLWALKPKQQMNRWSFIEHAGEPMLVAAGKSLLAVNPTTGDALWRATPSWLGVTLEPAPVAPAGRSRAAVRIGEVFHSYPAEKAGVQSGDLVLSFDGKPVSEVFHVTQLCSATAPGKTVDLVLLRDGRALNLKATLDPRPDSVPGHENVFVMNPADYVSAVGIDGDTVIALRDYALIWLDAKNGTPEKNLMLSPMTPHARPVIIIGGAMPPNLLFNEPVVRDGRIIAPSGDRIVAADIDGTRLWDFDLSDCRLVNAAIDSGRVVVVTARNVGAIPNQNEAMASGQFVPELFVLDAYSGATISHGPLGVDSNGECEITTGNGLALFNCGGVLLCYDLASGVKSWSVSAEDAGGGNFDSTIAGESVFAALSNGTLAAIHPVTGKVLWKASIGGRAYTVIDAGDRIIALAWAADSYYAQAVSKKDGSKLWQTKIAEPVQMRAFDFGSSANRKSVGPVVFAAVKGNVLFCSQNLTANNSICATVSAIRISDGRLMGHNGLEFAGGYNVFGGQISGGVVRLLTDAGVIGLSAGDDAAKPE